MGDRSHASTDMVSKTVRGALDTVVECYAVTIMTVLVGEAKKGCRSCSTPIYVVHVPH